MFAAHTHILMNLSFVDTLIPSLLSDSYPGIVTHAITVQELAFPDSLPFPPTISSEGVNWQSLIPWPKAASAPKNPVAVSSNEDEERRFSRMRWGWVGLLVVALTLYVRANIGLAVALVNGDSAHELIPHSEDDEDDEEGEE